MAVKRIREGEQLEPALTAPSPLARGAVVPAAAIPKKKSKGATEQKITVKKGILLFDEALDEALDGALAPGRHYVVFRRETRRLEAADGNVRVYDGAWYHEAGAEVDDDNYQEACEWSSLSEIVEWRKAAIRGEGFTANLDPFAKTRADKFIVHPLVREDLIAESGFWTSLKESTDMDAVVVASAFRKARAAHNNLNECFRDGGRINGSTTVLMCQLHSLIEILGDDVQRRLKRTGKKGDDDRDYVATTNDYFVATELLWLFERILKIAGFVEMGGVWRPLTGDAVVRVLGPNSLKTGRNVLRKIKGYKKNDLKDYYAARPDGAIADRKFFLELAQLDQADDDTVLLGAEEELGSEAFGRDKKLYPPWILRHKMDAKRTSPSASAVDPRVHWFSYVVLDEGKREFIDRDHSEVRKTGRRHGHLHRGEYQGSIRVEYIVSRRCPDW